MRILVYEFITATGTGSASLRAEGRAMREAVAADFAEIPGISVTHDWADAFDAALLIAPETDGVLAELARQMEASGKTLLSPGSEFCAWASDKSLTASTLAAAGVRVPRGILLRPDDLWPREFQTQAVVKPNDGCGSQGVRRLNEQELARCAGRSVAEVAKLLNLFESDPSDGRTIGPLRVESFVEGLAVSIALLRGPAGVISLPTCTQELSDDGHFVYRGGRCPIEPSLAARAESSARSAIGAMPVWQGYVGLDIVLGAAEDGSQDFVIEVNPRMTTSYVGLRAKCRSNLAQALLDVAAGRPPRITLRPGEVTFDSAGVVRYRMIKT